MTRINGEFQLKKIEATQCQLTFQTWTSGDKGGGRFVSV